MAIPALTSLDRCEINVDDELVILAETSGDSSFHEFLQSSRREGLEEKYDIADGTPVEGEFDAMVWPGLALAGTPCEMPTVIHSFTIGIQVEHPEDEEESVRALSELIQPFMKAAIEQSVCTPGNNRNSEYSAP